MLLYLLVSVILLIICNVKAQQSCLTPFNNPGICINIKNCRTMVNILEREKPLSRSSAEFIRQSKCGRDGKTPIKVCCEEQVAEASDEPPNPPDVSNHKSLGLLEHNICGPFSGNKIIGGNKTGIFDYPWMALIAYKVRNQANFDFRCGGTIINKRYILTAAHCVTALPSTLTLLGVRVGEHDISTEQDCEGYGPDLICATKYQDTLIQRSHYHPEFSTVTKQNDIGLLRLDRDINFESQNVKPICLPINANSSPNKKKVIVTGWGATESALRSKVLLQIRVPLISNEECARRFRNWSGSILYKQICAGGENGIDACVGDSGGPLQSPALYSNNDDVRFIQYGIVSFGLKKCGTQGFPGIYTRVSYFMDWILNTITQ